MSTHAGRITYLVLATTVLAFPAGLAVVSIARAIARFGLSETLSSIPLVLVVTLGPPTVWAWYLVRPPATRREWVRLGLGAVAALSAIVVSPLAPWSVPPLLAVAPEARWCWLAARRRRQGRSTAQYAAAP